MKKSILIPAIMMLLSACGSTPEPTDEEIRTALVDMAQKSDNMAYREQQNSEGPDVTPERSKVFKAQKNKCDKVKSHVYLCDVKYEAKFAYDKIKDYDEKIIIYKLGKKWHIDFEKTMEYQETGQLPKKLVN